MKTCLVLEGGGLRGIYTAGVLDALYRENIKIDAIIGTSMGTIVGINYISKQPGRALRYNLKYVHDKRYIGINQLIKTGDIVNEKFAYHDIPEKLDKFDYHTFDKSPIKLYCTVTNVKTGKAEYKLIRNVKEEIDYLRAGASLPGISRIVRINGKKYLDGGVADPIPINKALALGYDKIIVITTRVKDYRKRKTPINPLGLIYHLYPKFVVAINARSKKYNKTVEKIQKLEKENKIFVIRPSKRINIKRIEKNDRTITHQYNLGKEDFKNKKNDLLKYLETK